MSDERWGWPPNYTELYKGWLDPIKEVGWGLGYSMAFHGSLKRDLDVIAAPWIEDAVPAEVLAEAVRELISGRISPPPYNPGKKPHGRRVWTILWNPIGEDYSVCHAFIDLSIMPRVL